MGTWDSIPSFTVNPWRWLKQLVVQRSAPVPIGLVLINFLCQRLLRVNGEYPFPVHFTSRVVGRVAIGRNVWKSFALSGGCYIQGGNGVEIGNETIFGPGVKIISANHTRGNLAFWDPAPPIRIGMRCWIGANAIILPGVNLGDDVIVGAGAVVTKHFPAGSIIIGVPAQAIVAKPINGSDL